MTKGFPFTKILPGLVVTLCVCAWTARGTLADGGTGAVDGVQGGTFSDLQQLRRSLEATQARLRQLEARLESARLSETSRDHAAARDADSSGPWSGTGQMISQSRSAESPRCGCEPLPKVYAPLVADADDGHCAKCGGKKEPKKRHILSHYSGYDEGFFIRPFNPQDTPHELVINGRIQFRHVGFDRDVDFWTDNGGTTRPVRSRNYFDTERARLYFKGTAFDPRLTYFLHLDGDTDGREFVDFFDYWWAWKFSDALQVQLGKRKVAAVRNWLLPAWDTLLVDRPLANDFFRPSRTQGIWAVGQFGESGHYEAMVGNGYRTENTTISNQNNRFAFAGTQWWEPWGDFGTGYSDYECHRRAVIQFGHSFVYARQDGLLNGEPLQEADFVRLTDGTVLDSEGALAPGVTVNEFNVTLYTIDLAMKYRGLSINAEIYNRWLQRLRGDGPLPLTKLYQSGYFVQGSYYLIPRTVYVAARVSRVNGLFGDHYEYAGGVNWYVYGNRNLKLTFDVTSLDGSPLNNTASDILVGDDGTLFRTQFQAMF